MPLISVLMPFYNCERTLSEAIESILSQTMGDFELLLTDDGSTDGSRMVAQSYAAADSRIRLQNGEQNLGLVRRLNEGIDLAKGEFIARMDGDDWSVPHRFATQLAYLREHDDVLAVSSAHIHMDGEGVITGAHEPDVMARHDAYQIPAREPYLPHPFLMIRTGVIRHLGRYRHVLHSEDADLCWRLSDIGKIRNIAEEMGLYRQHDRSISASSNANGRLQSTYSQLAAISARRRMEGQPDLDFPLNLAEQSVENAGSFEKLTSFLSAAHSLNESERQYLLVSSIAKFLQFSTWRPWRLETDDIRFASKALSFGHRTYLDPPSYRNIRRVYKHTFKRLWRTNRRLDALRFLSMRIQLSDPEAPQGAAS